MASPGGSQPQNGGTHCKAEHKKTQGISKTKIIKCQPEGSFVHDHYETVRGLGVGGFGTVTLVRDRARKYLRVCKKVNTEDMDLDTMNLVKREISLLSTLDHPHIVRLYEFATDSAGDQLLLILEYVDGGDAQSYRRKCGGRLPEDAVAQLAHQVLVALAYCHARGVVHRDVKPENIMLSARSKDKHNGLDCKLIDFGVAAFQSAASNEVAGSPPYMAPEVLRSRSNITPKADIFSLGCSIVELLAGLLPFGSCKDYGGKPAGLFAAIRGYRRHGFQVLEQRFAKTNWSTLSEDARAFVTMLLKPEPVDRPTAHGAVLHPWVEQHRPTYSGLTDDLLGSMVAYAASPHVLRCCLFILAARSDLADAQVHKAPFLHTDKNSDGFLSLSEFEEAVQSVTDVDGEAYTPSNLFDAMDLSHSGKVSYTEFVAACACMKFKSTEDLIVDAFEALDTDRDGLVNSTDDILPYFNQRSLQGPLAVLPQTELFDVDEWCECLKGIEVASMQTTGVSSTTSRAQMDLSLTGSWRATRSISKPAESSIESVPVDTKQTGCVPVLKAQLPWCCRALSHCLKQPTEEVIEPSITRAP